MLFWKISGMAHHSLAVSSPLNLFNHLLVGPVAVWGTIASHVNTVLSSPPPCNVDCLDLVLCAVIWRLLCLSRPVKYRRTRCVTMDLSSCSCGWYQPLCGNGWACCQPSINQAGRPYPMAVNMGSHVLYWWLPAVGTLCRIAIKDRASIHENVGLNMVEPFPGSQWMQWLLMSTALLPLSVKRSGMFNAQVLGRSSLNTRANVSSKDRNPSGQHQQIVGNTHLLMWRNRKRGVS